MINRRYLTSRNVGPSKRKDHAWVTYVLLIAVLIAVLVVCSQGLWP